MIDRRRFLTASATLALAPTTARAQTATLPVAASFSIVADLVREVGGERVTVATLVPPGGDAHMFQPSPADARKVADAKLVFVNGLGLEGWMPRLVEASGAHPRLVTLSEGVEPLGLDHGKDENGAAKADRRGHHHDVDAHAWQSIGNAAIYVENIRKALGAADPAAASVYAASAAAYVDKLDALEAEVRAAIAGLPPSRRVIVTTHDAFGYFGAAYGFEFVAPQGVSTESEASAKDVAKIIRQIKTRKIPAVFLENVSDPRLIEQIARETGARIGGTLYSDSLSPPDGPAPTYVAMMRHNIRELTKALST